MFTIYTDDVDQENILNTSLLAMLQYVTAGRKSYKRIGHEQFACHLMLRIFFLVSQVGQLICSIT